MACVARSGGQPTGATFASIHGGDTQTIRAADLKLERFLTEADMAGAVAAAPASQLPAEPEVVLLTGANGFLGRFLLLHLLEYAEKRWAHLGNPPSCAEQGLAVYMC